MVGKSGERIMREVKLIRKILAKNITGANCDLNMSPSFASDMSKCVLLLFLGTAFDVFSAPEGQVLSIYNAGPRKPTASNPRM